MTDGWGIKTLQDRVTLFHLKLINFNFLNDGPCNCIRILSRKMLNIVLE